MKSGIINVYKEAGYTSFDVVAKLRGILHIKKIGHTGTLDPDATGVLPVCIGKATKVCDLLTNKDKTYTATLLMGKSTDTYDISGTVTKEIEVNVTEKEVRKVIDSFIGEIEQVPPMYSAIKVNGKKLYELAREGKVIERKPRKVTIYNIEVIDISLPRVTMIINCSKGTYIRSLCNDIGEKLGCCGCMESLIRNKVGDFSIDDAIIIEEIQSACNENRIEELIYPIDYVFSSYPKGVIKEESEKYALNGGKLRMSNLVDFEINYELDGNNPKNYSKFIRLYLQNGKFVGLYRKEQEDLILEKMFYEDI